MSSNVGDVYRLKGREELFMLNSVEITGETPDNYSVTMTLTDEDGIDNVVNSTVLWTAFELVKEFWYGDSFKYRIIGTCFLL